MNETEMLALLVEFCNHLFENMDGAEIAIDEFLKAHPQDEPPPAGRFSIEQMKAAIKELVYYAGDQELAESWGEDFLGYLTNRKKGMEKTTPETSSEPPYDARELLVEFARWSDESEEDLQAAVDGFLQEHPQREPTPDGRFSIEQIYPVLRRHLKNSPLLIGDIVDSLEKLAPAELPPAGYMSKEQVLEWIEKTRFLCHAGVRAGVKKIIDEINAADFNEPPVEPSEQADLLAVVDDLEESLSSFWPNFEGLGMGLKIRGCFKTLRDAIRTRRAARRRTEQGGRR